MQHVFKPLSSPVYDRKGDINHKKQSLSINPSLCTYASPGYIKQLLDEVEHGIMNYQNRGLCYLPKPKAEADNTDTRF